MIICKSYNVYILNIVLGNTTNLYGHLRSKHKAAYLAAKEIKIKSSEKSSLVVREEVIDEPVASTSKILDETIVPSGSSANKRVNTSSSDIFMSAFKRQKTIEASFGVITNFKEGGVNASRLNHAIMYMICKDNQPLSIVEDKGFRHLMKTASPHFVMPSRRTISRNIFNMYDAMKEIVINKLKNIQNFIITTDIWTDIQTRSYIGVTIHFVEDFQLNAALLGVYELDQRHTAEYIAEKLLEVCTVWNISKQNIVAVVTDGAANMLKAIDLSYGKNSMYCVLLTP